MSSSAHGDWWTDHSLYYFAGFHFVADMQGVPAEQTRQSAELWRRADQQLWMPDGKWQDEQKQVRDTAQGDHRANGWP